MKLNISEILHSKKKHPEILLIEKGIEIEENHI